jgi:hypothetical protein
VDIEALLTLILPIIGLLLEIHALPSMTQAKNKKTPI